MSVAKALRPLDSLAYPLRCVVPVYILILCACRRSLSISILVASVDCGAASSLASVLLVSPAIVPCLLVLVLDCGAASSLPCPPSPPSCVALRISSRHARDLERERE
mmetsp:Transcript_16058/g.52327  ORF Transcript_16058/g.52327 Transcript_16058/m.52327 type:complete len:107 (+) Transcript_16058:296-616(+)